MRTRSKTREPLRRKQREQERLAHDWASLLRFIMLILSGRSQARLRDQEVHELVVVLRGDVLPDQVPPAQQGLGARCPRQESVVVPAAVAQPPPRPASRGAGDQGQVQRLRSHQGAVGPGLQDAVLSWHQFSRERICRASITPLATHSGTARTLPRSRASRRMGRVSISRPFHITEHGFRLAVDLPVQHMAADGPVRLPAVVRGQGRHLLGDQRPELTFCHGRPPAGS